ncbi:MAG TPA: endonuclease/exonuclease/phosphatase family protein [Nostocaceae cyanobacterium]|nr:endonuclease/exonuclease/phosphatase family protein [Nostocaceae cyanobacterium]
MKITVMTFNLRYDKPDPGERQWQNRVGAIASLIKHYQPDLLGTQEGKAHQLADLKALLPEYNVIGGDRTGTGQGEHCAIFYHYQRLQCQQTQDFYLSDTPHIPGSITPSWGNRLPRMATWAKFTILNTSYSLTLVNTHLDHESFTAREFGAALVYRHLGKFSPDNYLLLTGDFNAQPQTKERQIFLSPLANNIKLQDALANLPYREQKTVHEFTGDAWGAIDTIYCDQRLQIEKTTTDRQKWQGIWPSDHFPVIVTLNFPPHN